MGQNIHQGYDFKVRSIIITNQGLQTMCVSSKDVISPSLLELLCTSYFDEIKHNKGDSISALPAHQQVVFAPVLEGRA